MKTWFVEVPLRSVHFATVRAATKKRAEELMNHEAEPEGEESVEGIDTEVSWHGRARARLDE